MAGPEKGLSIPGADPVREYSPEEERALTLNLKELLKNINNGLYAERSLDASLLFDFHAKLFGGVRGHAGRCRKKGFGQEYVTFGPNRSARRDDVPVELDKLFQRVRARLRQLGEYREEQGVDADYVLAAMECAIQTHADVVRIHPFEDGNGRTSRALMGHILLMLGLDPIPIEAPKQEYNDCLNAYFSGRGSIRPLTDLYIGLYPFRSGR